MVDIADIPENVDLRWIARHLVELRRDVREIRDDLDKLIGLSRRLLEDGIVTGGALVRIERRLDRLEQERAEDRD